MDSEEAGVEQAGAEQPGAGQPGAEQAGAEQPGTEQAYEALSDTVPTGYDVIIRILPPFTRDRPQAGTFAQWTAQVESDDWASAPDLRAEPASWTDTAAAFGRELGEVPRSWELLGMSYGDGNDAIAEDGWRYSEPSEGTLPADLFARVMSVLTDHTQTPDHGVAGVWDGYGGLVSAQGVGWFFAVPDHPRWLPRPLFGIGLRVMQHVLSFRERRRRFGMRAALHGLLVPGLEQPPGTGVLPREAALGERLSLPGRDYVCFEAGPRALAAVDWPARTPWVPSQELGDPQSPNIVWPEGREWVLVTEIDFNSTLVACSAACAGALLGAPGIEAHRIRRDAGLF